MLLVAILDRNTIAVQQTRVGYGWRAMVGDSRNRTAGEAVFGEPTHAARLLATHCRCRLYSRTTTRNTWSTPELEGRPPTTAARKCGAVALARPNRYLLTIPSECTSNEFAASGRQCALRSSEQTAGGRNIHHLKGFGICVRRNCGETDGRLDSRSNPVRVENAGSTLFPVIIELLRRKNKRPSS